MIPDEVLHHEFPSQRPSPVIFRKLDILTCISAGYGVLGLSRSGCPDTYSKYADTYVAFDCRNVETMYLHLAILGVTMSYGHIVGLRRSQT